MLDPIGIQRTRDILRDHLNNVLRMMEDIDSGDRSHTVATVTMTCNAAASALLTAAQDIDVVKADRCMRLAAREQRFERQVPRYYDTDLPKVASTGGLS